MIIRALFVTFICVILQLIVLIYGSKFDVQHIDSEIGVQGSSQINRYYTEEELRKHNLKFDEQIRHLKERDAAGEWMVKAHRVSWVFVLSCIPWIIPGVFVRKDVSLYSFLVFLAGPLLLYSFGIIGIIQLSLLTAILFIGLMIGYYGKKISIRVQK